MTGNQHSHDGEPRVHGTVGHAGGTLSDSLDAVAAANALDPTAAAPLHHAHSHAHAHDHGPVDPDLAESRDGVRVLMISLLILGLTAAAQILVVVLTGSVALLADTVHNVGDALTAVPLAIAFLLARRAPTARFAWGLGRAEDLAGLVIVGLIAFSGLFALEQSIARLVHPHTPHHLAAGIGAGVLGFVGNELVATYRIRQGTRMHSAALVADGQHARVDGFTSLSVALGLILVWAGIELADPVIGIVISLVIARITWNTARQVGIRLLDGIEAEYLDPIHEHVAAALPADALMAVRARWFGHVIHVEVAVDPAHLTHAQLTTLAAQLEQRLRDAGTRARRVAVVIG
jgi:cation diffusion facilitator family transporter